MAKEPLGSVLHYIHQIAAAPAGQERTDKALLESFATCRDEAAFAALMRRHGALVWGVCQRVLQQTEDAEDAFQATFLVLARKAGRIRWQADVGNWLYAVAFRTALKAKAGAGRRNLRERQLHDMPAAETDADSTWLEIRPVLDEELNCLPLKYRAPVILHYFEGKTYSQAAEALGWPAGTVATRLAQARELLRRRLARRGFGLTGGLLAAALSQNAAPAMAPAALMDSTLRAAALFAAGQAVKASLISAKVATLTEGVLKAMFLSKLKIGVVLVLALCVVSAGAGVVGYRTLPAVEAKGPLDGKLKVEVAQADPPNDDKQREEIERLRKEIEELRRELRPLRDKLNELNPKVAPQEEETSQVTYQGKPTDYWLKMLKDRDPEFRRKALTALGAIGVNDKRVIPALVESLKDENYVAQFAAQALSGIGKDAVPALLLSLKGKNITVRSWAALALGQIGPEAKDAIPALLEALEDKDSQLRFQAVTALGRMAPASESAIPVLIKTFKDEDQNVRGAAPLALSQFRRAAVAPLIEALKDQDDEVRALAAASLRNIGESKAAIPALILALRDKNQQVRNNAALALIDPNAVPALVEALNDKDPVIRAACARVLGGMGPKFANSAVPALVKAMGDEDKRVREAAAQAYKSFPNQGQTDP